MSRTVHQKDKIKKSVKFIFVAEISNEFRLAYVGSIFPHYKMGH
jgi:hypothetical protein